MLGCVYAAAAMHDKSASDGDARKSFTSCRCGDVYVQVTSEAMIIGPRDAPLSLVNGGESVGIKLHGALKLRLLPSL